ncbi:MAG: isoleucine--tRNA ligase [Patescibacteria group bacterium]|nr:isoleucine--tRNA ligase [Patescibacteria group bacterium]
MSINLPQIEKKILAFWRRSKIFEKTLKKTKRGRPFVFFEGPPTANALPGIHHVLSRIFKDIICRYKTMKGYYVERKAGWDTHGLPVELEMEKKLGLRGKPEIEKYGIAKFNKKCKESVWQYKKEWENFSERIAFWLDYKNAYITYENYYIETVWWILKQIWQKGLLYQDYKVVPHCPRCGTTLSSHEVALGYENVEDISLYLKFKKIDDPNTYFFVWTTTPWTLPGNVALAIHPGATYVKVKVNDEYFILAEPRLNVLENFEIVEKYQGKDLIGQKYEGLYPAQVEGRIYEVISGEFVSMEDGTGIVHIAPAFGEEDMEVIKIQNSRFKIQNLPTFPILMTVNPDGNMAKGIIGEGKFVKEADKDVIDDLKKRNILWKLEKIHHDYPFCWRCDSSLLYYAKKSWFIRMSEPKIKEELIKNNEKINWVPSFIKEGRFGVWLKEVKDWALSRERYWGTPLPVWQCQTGKSQTSNFESQKCDNTKVIGSFEELEKLSGRKVQDPHRPYIDEFVFQCEKCGGKMKRVPEVIDCWFDSGAMPFAQHHYPFENKKRYEKNEVFPADYIAEGIDQTRGWFYTLLAISTLLEKGPAYKNVICHGLVLDEKGEKMSKSRGNVVEPEKIINQYGADTLRFYFYTINQPGEAKCFSEKQVEEVMKKVFLILWNVVSFYEMYRGKIKITNLTTQDLVHVLDRWIVAKFNLLIKDVSDCLERYEITNAARSLANFIDELSTWYLRRSRERFKSEKRKIKLTALKTLRYIILNLAKILAPFTPFLAEYIYQTIKGPATSVHLENWPSLRQDWFQQKIIDQMKIIREITHLGLEQRAKNKIPLRQPLNKITIKFPQLKKLERNLEQIILDELNIKKIIYQPTTEKSVELDFTLTPQLREEGVLRELVRQINFWRKEKKLTLKDKVKIYYQTDSKKLTKIIEKNLAILKKQTLASKIERREKLLNKQKKEIEIEREKLFLVLGKKER